MHKLEEWEIAIIKAMLERNMIPQTIQAYFSRPNRTVNHARILEIRDGKKHTNIEPATEEILQEFFSSWPEIDPSTGLHLKGDELLVKAREAMIASVHTFNSAGLNFRAEIFIVTAIISWTYLMHAHFKREGIDYRYKKGGSVEKTPSGAERYWDLRQCLSHQKCPLDRGVINNLNFLLEIRNEIEHRMTNRIDNALSAKLQACCINFNDAIKKLFGAQFSLERRLPIALQFVTFDGAQRGELVGADLPPHISIVSDKFHGNLTDEQLKDPKFSFRVAFVLKLSSRASKADQAVEFVKPGSPESEAVERILLKEVERPKYLPSEIVKRVKAAGYPKFKMHNHTEIVNKLSARSPDKGYGIMVAKTWYWYEHWLSVVIDNIESAKSMK